MSDEKDPNIVEWLKADLAEKNSTGPLAPRSRTGEDKHRQDERASNHRVKSDDFLPWIGLVCSCAGLMFAMVCLESTFSKSDHPDPLGKVIDGVGLFLKSILSFCIASISTTAGLAVSVASLNYSSSPIARAGALSGALAAAILLFLVARILY